MKQFFKYIFLFCFLCGIGIFITCSHYKNDNPYDVLYPDADYFLKCEWNSLPAILYLDTVYSLPCSTSSAPNSFLYINVDEKDSGFVAVNKVHPLEFDTLAIRFKKEHVGILHIIGMRPNGKLKYDSSGSLVIVNQYKPIVSVLKDKKVIRGYDTIPVIISNRVDSIATVYWRLSGSAAWDSLSDTFRLDTMKLVVNTVASGSLDTMFVWARNNIGYVSDTEISVLRISSYIPNIGTMTIPDTISCGDTLRFNVHIDSVNASFKAVISSVDGLYSDTSGLTHYSSEVNIVMRHPFIDTGKVKIHLCLIDSLEIFRSDVIDYSLYLRYSLPALYIQPLMEVPVDRSVKISVIDSHFVASGYLWKFSNGALSDTTDSSLISKKYSSAITDTVTVYGINRYGFAGKAVKSVIFAKPMKYYISAGENIFPSNVTAGRSSGFGVTMDSLALFKTNNGVYRWVIDSAGLTVFDTVGTNLSSINRYFADSGVFLASVVAYDASGDSSNLLKRLIIAHRYAPGCRFKKSADTAIVNVWDTVKVHCWDSNPDTSGHITNIYWKLKPNIDFESGTAADSIYPVLYQTLGEHVFYAYSKDNDGFISSKDSMRFTVLSYQPYLNTFAHDTVIYVGSTLLMRVDFHVGFQGTPIMNYIWRICGTDNVNATTTTTDTLSRLFSNEGIDTVIVKCFDQKATLCFQPDTFIVTISGNRMPVVSGLKPDTVWIMDTSLFSADAISLKPGVPLTKYMISWDNSSNFTQYSQNVFPYQFNSSGIKPVRLYVADSTGDESKTINDTVFVRLGKPVIDSMTVNTSLTDIFVLKPQRYLIYSRDSNGVVDSFKIMWNSSDFSTGKDSFFQYNFIKPDTGSRFLKALVKDNDGIWSDTMYKQIHVRLGKPAIKSFKADSVVYTYVKRRYTINAMDSAGKIDSIIMLIDKSVKYLKDSVFDTTFSTAGVRHVKIVVKNDRGMLSDTLNDSIVVNYWPPVIRSISADVSIDSIFVLDTHSYNIKGHVNYGKIKQIKVSWNGADIFTDSLLTGDSAKFRHVFTIADTSVKAIRIRLIDTNSQIADSMFPVKIRLGKPVIDNMTPRMLWINDDTTFNITVHDTNGSADSIIIDWGDGTGQFRKARWDVIKHKYAVSQAGVHTVKIVTWDDDGIFSDTAVFIDSVHLGKPLMRKITANDSMVWISGLTYDTLVCPYRPATGVTTIGAGSYDTNGSVARFYWDAGSGLVYDTTKTNLLATTKLNINQSYLTKVSGKDDDSIATSNTIQFYTCPHTPPPSLNNVNCEQATNGKKISWSGKDGIDSNATLYKVLIKKDNSITTADETNPTYIIQDFTAGSLCTSGSPSFDYSLTFTPNQGSGSYYWLVIAKNSRGQQSRNSGTPSFQY
jgi:hypothetical protein